jgi:NAD+ kinase
MTSSFDAILDGQYQEDVRALLSARLERPGMEPLACHALNDIVIQKFETGRMVEFETWIGGVFVNTHGGDGLVVATSTGSTAYALSCGGPIIHPRLDALVLAPISPHTLSDRPIVVGRDSEIELRLAKRSPTRAQVTFDGTVLGDLDHGGRLTVGAARQSVTLLHPPGHDFFRILRSKLHWGRSARHPDEGEAPC